MTYVIINVIIILVCVPLILIAGIVYGVSKQYAKSDNYVKNNHLEENSTIFYEGGYCIVMGYMEHLQSYSIMPIKSKKTEIVSAEYLIANSISQEKLLEALARAESFTELYNDDEHLLKKYLDDT